MGTLYSFKANNSFSRDQLNYISGVVKNIHYGDIHTKYSSHFYINKENVPYINPSVPIQRINIENYCIEGDMIFADASEDMEDIGKSIELMDINGERLLSGLHTILARQKINALAIGFGGHLFKSAIIRDQIKIEAHGTKVLGISSRRLSNINIFYPANKLEQQKIADCLSSLDDLITAENKKLDALKTHKKGLMQQLFPAEGETVPRLRFPEFSGEWEERKLGEISDNLDNQRVPITENNRVKGIIPYYGASGIVDYVDGFIFDENLLCVSEDGANLIARTSPIAFSISGKTWVNNHAHVLKFKSIHTQNIVENYLNSISLEDFLTGMAQPKLNKAMLENIPIPLPIDSQEQQKIADFLSSVDEFISAQIKKIDALKTHKKGLMQQLFPVLSH